MRSLPSLLLPSPTTHSLLVRSLSPFSPVAVVFLCEGARFYPKVSRPRQRSDAAIVAPWDSAAQAPRAENPHLVRVRPAPFTRRRRCWAVVLPQPRVARVFLDQAAPIA